MLVKIYEPINNKVIFSKKNFEKLKKTFDYKI